MTMPGDEREGTRAAVERVREALRALVRAAEASTGTRCPHRGAGDVCTYPASCANQRRVAGEGNGPTPLRCAGDAGLRWNAGRDEGTP